MVQFITQREYAPGSLERSQGGAGLADVLAQVFSARRAAEAHDKAEARQNMLDKARMEEAAFQRAQSDIHMQLQLRRAEIEDKQAGAAAMSMAQAPKVSAVTQGVPEIGPEEAGPAASQLVVPEKQFTVAPVTNRLTGEVLRPAATFPLEYREQKAARKEQEDIAGGKVIRVTPELHESLPPAIQGIYKVGSVIPRETADKLVSNLTKPEKAGRTLQALDTKTKQPTFVSQEQIDAEPGRYQPMKTGVNVNLGAGEATSTLSPQGLDMVAEMFSTTGNMPSFGMGKAAADTRQKIINRAAELHPELNLASNVAGFKADVGSLGSLQKQTDAITAFENTANANSDLLHQTLNKIPDLGSKFLNAPARQGASQFGSEEMARFSTLRQSVANEYARLLSQGGQMSDSARHEANVLIDENSTAGQIKAALKALKEEAANRHMMSQAQLDAIRGRAGGGVGGGGHAAGGETRTRLKFNPATGELE